MIEKNLSSSKFILVANRDRRKATINQYYSIRKHCKKGEVMMIIDGDDELVGKQVFRLFNAIYQSKSANYVYTNYITF
jgi:hypothetical protein